MIGTKYRLNFWFTLDDGWVYFNNVDFYDEDEAREAFDQMKVSDDAEDIRLYKVIYDRKYGTFVEEEMIVRKGRFGSELF